MITPYKSQLSLLRSRFLNAFGSLSAADIEFNTVDGFQGREVDILLLSTVRAAHSGVTASVVNSNSIGFVADVRRMNVALTRAKLSLWILGNARTLQTNQNWAALVKDAEKRNLIMRAKMPYHSMFKTDKSNCSVENFDNHARPLKHEKKVKDGDQNKILLGKDTVETKKKRVASEVWYRNKGNGDENSSSALGKYAPCKGRKSEDEHFSITKDMGNKTLGKRQLKFQQSRNNLDFPVEEASGGQKVSKRPTLHSGGNRSSSTEISVSSMKGSHKEKDAVNQGTASNKIKVDEVSKRKQQREAVDAILYSSLISTKKEDTVTKVSAKRPFSSSVASRSIKPSKSKSGKPLP